MTDEANGKAEDEAPAAPPVAMQLNVLLDVTKQIVVVQFTKEIAWFSMTKEEAMNFVRLVKRTARELK
jgi:hypothetical protein